MDSEVAFALNLLKDRDLKVIGITGTDGKSTTSALTAHILSRVYSTYLLGNFGEPLIARMNEIKDGDVVVLELSSYQLEDGEKYRLNGATIINVAPDHLNRYADMNEYRMAKEKIFINQEPADVAVLGAQKSFFESWKKQTKARIIRYDFGAGADFSYHDKAVWYLDQILISDEDILLKGEHNRENIMIASAFAHYFGVSLKTIREAVADFRGLEHRTEYLGRRRGVDFINDSKATTVQAVIKSLSTAQDSIILILGGSDKKLDFTELRPYLKDRVKKVICYGETKDTIAAALNFPALETVFEFDQAFALAVRNAQAGDTVLLSPGCASFDQFNSYEERGQRFKNLVENYEKEIICNFYNYNLRR
ncbi:MAG: UDP-N-acetylmuramoyl-L-alanine--D-glutamate ligase [Spirochaetae bacterium HGW-Spirochaetae-6]|nr:MAG: UDP-N-acetylmuramoyl-L-alanine--D-glutamate ligase [Spirochaetae bacterium HGW-Spirochaetae-6]